MHNTQMFISRAMTKPSAVTAMKVKTNTKAENALDALSSTCRVRGELMDLISE